MDRQAYDREHIPGCIFWSAFAPLLSDLRINFDVKAMEKLLSNCGINNDSTVVTVHRDFTATSGLIFWLLKTFGHQDVRVLNGGFPKWKQAGLPTTNEPTAISPSNYQIQKMFGLLKSTEEKFIYSSRQKEMSVQDISLVQSIFSTN